MVLEDVHLEALLVVDVDVLLLRACEQRLVHERLHGAAVGEEGAVAIAQGR